MFVWYCFSLIFFFFRVFQQLSLFVLGGVSVIVGPLELPHLQNNYFLIETLKHLRDSVAIVCAHIHITKFNLLTPWTSSSNNADNFLSFSHHSLVVLFYCFLFILFQFISLAASSSIETFHFKVEMLVMMFVEIFCRLSSRDNKLPSMKRSSLAFQGFTLHSLSNSCDLHSYSSVNALFVTVMKSSITE